MIIVIVNVLIKVMPVDSFPSMAHKLTLLQQALIKHNLGCDDQQQHSSVEMKCIRLSSSQNPYISPASSPLGTSQLRILLAVSTLFSQSRPCPDINGAKFLLLLSWTRAIPRGTHKTGNVANLPFTIRNAKFGVP